MLGIAGLTSGAKALAAFEVYGTAEAVPLRVLPINAFDFGPIGASSETA
jgi:hypothetical protein